MRRNIFKILFAIVAVVAFTACNDFPIDDEGLLITDRDECYVSNFDLAGTDRVSVRVGNAEIDNEACTIKILVYYGTDLKHLYPQFSLVTDAILSPKVTGLEDFSDIEHPRQYTVISGSRRVQKTYTVYVTVQERNH